MSKGESGKVYVCVVGIPLGYVVERREDGTLGIGLSMEEAQELVEGLVEGIRKGWMEEKV